MKKHGFKVWGWFLLLTFSMASSGCAWWSDGKFAQVTNSKGIKGASASAGHERSTVYRIQGTRNTIFLLGSIHLLKASDYPLPLVFEDAYQQSDRIVLELSPQESARMGDLIHQNAYFTSSRTLWETLPDDLTLEFQSHVKSLGRDIEPYRKMKPWYAAISLASDDYHSLGASYEHGLDAYFEQRARKDGKKIGGLEMAEAQLNEYLHMAEEVQIEMLRQTLAELQDSPRQYHQLKEAWRMGQIEKLTHFLGLEKEESRAVSLRNRAWIQEIEKALQESNNVMFVVGAGHLLGPGGLIEMLRKKGVIPVQMEH